jgi:5-methylcytosine-specific restriction endonuclease McrA
MTTQDAARAALLAEGWAPLTIDVWLRAQAKCEYCGTPIYATSEVYFRGSHLDHILAEKFGGATDFDNLALSCGPCNLIKGNYRVWDGIGDRPAREELKARAEKELDMRRTLAETRMQRQIPLLVACGLEMPS